jgi:hypothetical protein
MAGEGVDQLVKAGTNSAKSVPPVVWIIAVVGGLGVSFFLSSRKKSTGSKSEDLSPQTVVYTGNANGAGGNTAVVDTGTGNPKTNEEWAQRAKQALLAMNYLGADVDRAVNAYLAGQTLTVAQNGLINIAIQKVGPPPQILPPTAGPNDPGTGSGGGGPSPDAPVARAADYTNGAQGELYTVKAGDTLFSIANAAYGITPGAWGQSVEGANKIYNANWYKIADMKNLSPGTQLYVPVIASLEFQAQGDKVGKIPLGKGAEKGDEQLEWFYKAGMVPSDTALYDSGERYYYGR